MFPRPMRVLLLLALAGLLAGCHARPAAFLPEESAKFSLADTEKFQLLDRTAQAAIACTGLQERYDDTGRLEVVITLLNRQNEPVAMESRCVFKDVLGQPAGDSTPWLPLNIEASATETVRYFATAPLARRFTVLVRSAAP